MNKNIKIIIIGIVGFMFLSTAYSFFNPRTPEYTCYTDFQFQYDKPDYVNAKVIVEQIKNDVNNISLPYMYVYSVGSAPDRPIIYTLRIQGEHMDDSIEIKSIRTVLEQIPEISELTNSSTYCPPK
jgi:hypothetical protein